MDIDTVQQYAETRVEESDNKIGLRLLVAKLGQVAEASINLESRTNMSTEEKEETLSSLLAGLVVIIAHTASEEGVDLEAAVSERLSEMKARTTEQEELDEAMENLDFEAVANKIGLLDGEGEVEDDGEGVAEDRSFADPSEKDRMFY